MQSIGYPIFPYYRFSNLSAFPDINHFVSSGKKSVGFSDYADETEIRNNRTELAQAVGFDVTRLVTAHQVHSAHAAVVTEADAGCGALDRKSRLSDTDALVTAERGICLMVLSADCTPILLYDPVRQVIAAVHAGWRGTAARIAIETVKVMRDHFGSCPENIIAGIGPSIGPCCFEVGEEVGEVFRELFQDSGKIVLPGRSGKYMVNLWEANRQELLEAGLEAGHIEVAEYCTVCHPDRFFSYRKDGGQTGRFGAGIVLREECFS